MRVTSRIAAAALAVMFAAPALAQFGPPPPVVPQKGPARVWNDQVWVNDKPIFSADLGGGGVGGFTGILDRTAGTLCYTINAPGVDAPTGARIVAADAAPKTKPALVLASPAGGSSGGCVAVKPAVAEALLANPAGYAVEVDNKAYPGGAARAALSAWDGVRKVGA